MKKKKKKKICLFVCNYKKKQTNKQRINKPKMFFEEKYLFKIFAISVVLFSWHLLIKGFLD